MPLSLYEHPAWQHVPGQVMRPGGLTVTQQALAFCNLHSGANVLDVGCGAGASLHFINDQYDCFSTGIDLSFNGLKRAHSYHPGIPFVQASSQNLPFASESMDVLLSECTLSLFAVDGVLKEWRRVLKQGGALIISDLYARNPEEMNALRQLPAETCISSAMSREQIMRHLNQNGYEMVIWEDCSDQLKNSIACTFARAAEVDIFDLYIAAARAKLGYYFLVARKVGNGRT